MRTVAIVIVVGLVSVLCPAAYGQSLREDSTRVISAGNDGCPPYGINGEALTYVPGDDSLWISNDNNPSFCGLDRFTGEGIQSELRDSFFESWWGDTLHSDELELIASDGGNLIYLINNVNDPNECPVTGPTDIATIFKLSRPEPKGDFSIIDSHELPSANRCGSFVFNYKAMVVIDGSIYIADPDRGEIHLYDYESETIPTLSTSPILSIGTAGPPIIDLAFDGNYLWILRYQNPTLQRLMKFDWKTRTEVADYDLQNLTTQPATKWGGVAVNGRDIYLIENSTDANIYVFAEP